MIHAHVAVVRSTKTVTVANKSRAWMHGKSKERICGANSRTNQKLQDVIFVRRIVMVDNKGRAWMHGKSKERICGANSRTNQKLQDVIFVRRTATDDNF